MKEPEKFVYVWRGRNIEELKDDELRSVLRQVCEELISERKMQAADVDFYMTCIMAGAKKVG